jgi:hypothetical protein
MAGRTKEKRRKGERWLRGQRRKREKEKRRGLRERRRRDV